jgi:tryptophan halogenase
LNQRDDSRFWIDAREMDVPERIVRKMDLFRANGTLVKENFDIFLESSWLQVMLGQGILPRDYHPLADTLSDEQLRDKLRNTKATKEQPLPKIPAHDEFLRSFAGAGQ